MAVTNLTNRAVETAKENLRDTTVPGLEMLYYPPSSKHRDGTRSYRVHYRVNGDPKKRALRLGRVGEISLADARDLARDALAKARQGIDPREEQRQWVTRQGVTVANLAERYFERHVEPNNAQKTQASKRHALERYVLPKIGSRPVDNVSKRDIAEVVQAISHSASLGRQAHAFLRHMFEWGIQTGFVETDINPAARAPKPRAPAARARVLNDEEIQRIWSCDGTYPTMCKISLLTVQRKGSIAAMKWSAVDLESGLWRIPAEEFKAGQPFQIPLSQTAIDLLGRLERSGEHVFGQGGPYQAFSGAHSRLLKRSGTSDWRFHDLRRTGSSLAQRAGMPVDVYAALSGHKLGSGAHQVYLHHQYTEEKRQAAEAIEGLILKIIVK